jgi:hypothetical protein
MRFGFSNALGVTTSPTELIMSRTLILIAAASLVVISLARSAHAQQLPNATPGMVEMTEPPTPAPAGFNNRTNGFTEQAQFDRDRKAFEEVETILPETKDDNAATAGLRKRRSSANPPSSSENSEAGGGLGPVYNATSCVSCHQNPITGSSSQVSEIRAGRRDPNTGNFIEPPGGLAHPSARNQGRNPGACSSGGQCPHLANVSEHTRQWICRSHPRPDDYRYLQCAA